MTPLVLRLMDSKRFCQLFADAGKTFNRRSLSEDDKAALLEPLVAMIIEFNGPQEPTREERPSRVTPEMAARPATSAIQIGTETPEQLGFDPFKHPDADILATMPPDAPPNPESKRQEHLNMLRDAIANLRPHNPGETMMWHMPMHWNASEATLFFTTLGTHQLVPGVQGGFGVRLVNGVGWEITAQRIK